MENNKNKEYFSGENAICDENFCSGCGACAAACPKQCIHMEYNRRGAAMPVIDTKLCIECGKCRTICPQCKKTQKFHSAKAAYVARFTDDVVCEASSSGGIAVALGLEILKNHGVVYGAVMNAKTRTVAHERLADEEALYCSQGSKYVQSEISPQVYSQVKDDVKSGKTVLFIGTPCQIAGVKNYVGKISEGNLYLVELVCHGVPGAEVFREYCDMETEVQSADKITFRKKRYVLEFSENVRGGYERLNHMDLTPFTSIYFHGFIQGSIYRESCYHCPYARRERQGDITLGDSEYLDHGMAQSSVILYTERGAELFRKLKSVTKEEVPAEEMILAHPQLNHPMRKSTEQEQFARIAENRGIQKALRGMNRKKWHLIQLRRVIYGHPAILALVSALPKTGKLLRSR